jgi:Protein of unknown function (DUF3108)
MCRVRPGAIGALEFSARNCGAHKSGADKSGARRGAFLTALFPIIALTILGAALAPMAQAEPGAKSEVLPAQVQAVYRITFGLLGEIGTFKFSSGIEDEAYTLSAKAKIDTAVFDYAGFMTSTGSVFSATARPGDYSFRYKQKAVLSKKKVKSLSIAFDRKGVKDVVFVPPERPSPKAIPVTQKQLENVLDPLSGVMALSLGSLDRPCEQRLPIFDGEQRFDLVFTPTSRRPQKPGGDWLCHVRLIPISGHRKGKGQDSVITGAIEVVLRPVPKANILIPYRVTVPTIIGAAELKSEKVDITMPDRQRIALRR